MEKIYYKDRLDKKIINNLDLNSRLPSSQLAKKLKVSREVVDYRIKRLLKKGIISRFITHIRAEKIGYTVYKVYFKIKGMDDKQKTELIEYFCRHKNVYWVASCYGVYDLIVSLTETTVYKLNDILQEFFHKYDSYFISKDIAISTRIYECLKFYLDDKISSHPKTFLYGGEKGSIKLDDYDMELLKFLANNARMGVIELGKRIGLTGSAIIYRIRRLEKLGIISGYRCSLNAAKLGYVFCKIFLTLHFINPQKERELHEFCLQHPKITLFLYCIGRWDFEIEVVIEDALNFNELLMEIKSRFSEIIKDCTSVIISYEHKFDHFPESYPAYKSV